MIPVIAGKLSAPLYVCMSTLRPPEADAVGRIFLVHPYGASAFPSALSSRRNAASGDLPDGHAAQNPVQSSSQEYSASRFAKISIIESAIPSHKRGVSRSSRTLGTGCDGRRAPGAIIARTSGGLRTVKSCGPGAPTLVLSFAGYPRSDGGKKARSQEHEENR